MRAKREDGQGATPRRRVPGRRRRPLTDTERIAAVAADAALPVEDVLREVADFRLALETDMIIAAAAVDAESPDVLYDVIDDERLELATFHDRLLTRLADAAAEDEVALRRQRRRPVGAMGWGARVVAAAAAFVAVLGAGRSMVGSPGSEVTAENVAMQSADEHLSDLSSAVTANSPMAVRKAAQELHKTLETLIAEHADDPLVAERAARLISAEIALLRINDPGESSLVLAQARTLAKMLKQAAPAKVRASVAPIVDPVISAKPSPKPTATTSPKPTASPSPTASPKTSASSSPRTNPLDNAP